MKVQNLRLRKSELELIIDARKAELADLEAELREVNDGLVDALAGNVTKLMLRELRPSMPRS